MLPTHLGESLAYQSARVTAPFSMFLSIWFGPPHADAGAPGLILLLQRTEELGVGMCWPGARCRVYDRIRTLPAV